MAETNGASIRTVVPDGIVGWDSGSPSSRWHTVDVAAPTKLPPNLGTPQTPWPLTDRFPLIVGSGLSLAVLASAYRLALTGYRRNYVDALSELIERDPHLYAVLMQRVITACGARVVVQPRDPRSNKCIKLAKEVQSIVDDLQNFRQSLVTLAFSGFYFGIGGAEIDWIPVPRTSRRGPAIGWIPRSLRFIHSRRLNLPNTRTWDLHVWDQGPVVGDPYSVSRTTQGIFGLRVDDYPGKFVVFAPQLHADYPTREGVGRVVAFWSALKTMGARGAAQFVERYAKPWAIGKYHTTSTGIPRAAEASATNNDVAAADQALRALGTGSLAGAVIPDSIEIELKQIVGSRSAIGHKDWIDICNREISKGILGQTDTTDGGSSGSRARAQVQKTGSNQIARLDVMLIASCLQTNLIDWIARLNWPADYDSRPIISLAVDPEPDPYGVVKLASMAAMAGMPVDADEIARTIGIKLVNPGDRNARPMVPLKPMMPQDLHPDLFGTDVTKTGEAETAASEEARAEKDAEDSENEDDEPGDGEPSDDGEAPDDGLR